MDPAQRDEIIGTSEKHAIILLPYDHSWPDKFETEKVHIQQALGPIAIRIDHIGSTAIPGLGAKPIIDIDVSVANIEDEAQYLPALLSAGYELRIRSTGHRMLRNRAYDATGQNRAVNVHICEHGGAWERRLLLFRDYLRNSPADQALYFQAKAELAAQEWPNINSYAEAKSEIITIITRRAEQWALDYSWEL